LNQKNLTYPSKSEIIESLRDDEKKKGFEEIIAIIELNRKSENIALLKGELIQNDEIILRGKIATTPTQLNYQTWKDIEIGESVFIGFSIENKGETYFDMLREGFNNCLKEGKLPFVHR